MPTEAARPPILSTTTVSDRIAALDGSLTVDSPAGVGTTSPSNELSVPVTG